MNNISVSIITIGDELLIGQVIDTNSAWMAQELNKHGFTVRRRVAVGDYAEEIRIGLDEEKKYADIILLTGGLGPTADDITKPFLCEYFGGRMIVDENVLAHVKHLFEKIFRRPGPILERNLKQAEVPDTCTVLHNERGSAPGMWFEKEGKIFISMPGVPYEMQGLMTDEVIPRLVKLFKRPHIAHRTLLTVGVGESIIAEKIKDFEAALPGYIRLAYLPNYSMVRLRLSGTGSNKDALENEIGKLFIEMQELVKEYLVTNKDEKIEQVVARLLTEKNQTVTSAESCTGGYIAHLLTTDGGASAYFEGSIISYSYQAKENLLHVNAATLMQYGAVSEETVKEMVTGALQQLKTTYAIAVSGIMGPGGATPDKPIGTVWIAVGNNEKTITQKMHFRFDRMRNIQLTAMNALNMLRKLIISSS
ncbi:MAG: CinA family nicotinamide mononucleotide deamidase-related protein [Ferruginibacter sp.]